MSAKKPQATPKFDPAPLIEAGGGELRALARRLGVDPAVLCRPLTLNQADRFAVAIGMHPMDVWGPGVWWGDDMDLPRKADR